MGRITAFLQRKIFGIKVLYLVAVVAVVLLFFAFKLKPGISDDEAADTPTDAAEDTGLTDEETLTPVPRIIRTRTERER